MEKAITDAVDHTSQSHQQLARILNATRPVVVRMAELVQGIPDVHPGLGEMDGLLDFSAQITKSVIAYLNSLADLQETVADSLWNVMKAAPDGADEE